MPLPWRTASPGLAALIALALVAVLPLRSAAVSDTRGLPDGFEKRWQGITSFYEAGLQKTGIVGSSLWLVHDGRTVSRAWRGLKDLDSNQPVDEQTIFHWASITKTFTGIAIMQLRDRHRLNLDDAVVRYVPELRAVHDPFGDIADVKIRHLMTHSGGFRAGTWPWGGDKAWEPHEPTKWEQLVAMFPYTEVLFAPGSRFSYSNPGIVFLGRIIEELSGDPYEVYIDKNILKPLGMHRSYFDRAPYHLRADLSSSYYRRDGKLTAARPDVDTGITVSNGGLNAPLGDMVKYLAFLLGDPARTSEYDVVLPRASLEEMFVPQVKIDEPPAGRSMGLLFFHEQADGLQVIGHSGTQNGFLSHFYAHLPSRTAYIVNFNTAVETTLSGDEVREDTRVFELELRDRLFQDIFRLWIR